MWMKMGSIPFGETKKGIAVLQNQVVGHREDLLIKLRKASLQVLRDSKLLPDRIKQISSAKIAMPSGSSWTRPRFNYCGDRRLNESLRRDQVALLITFANTNPLASRLFLLLVPIID